MLSLNISTEHPPGWRALAARQRHVKIVATLGPAVSTYESLSTIIDAGVNVVRINAAHGTPESRAVLIDMSRSIARERGIELAVLMDLQGLKIRTGPLPGATPAMLARGSMLRVYPTPIPSTADQIGVTYSRLLEVVQPESRIMLADGLIELLVQEVHADHALCTIGRGGPLAARQGVTLPSVHFVESTLTDADRRDMAFAAKHQVEYVGLSFLSSAADVNAARGELLALGARPGLVAKIERPAALEAIEAIAMAADAVMVARGDLGVQLPPEQVPRAQKHIISVCNQLGTPVITATQMLESMIMQPVPTRAETSDVANAVLDGTDAVMLSAETATGRNPVAAVQMMDRIVREVERDGPVRTAAAQVSLPRRDQEDHRVTNAIGQAARALSDSAPIDLIVAFTLSGASARLIAKSRPRVPVIAITTDPFVARQLSLVWGVRALVAPLIDDVEQLFREATQLILDAGLARPDDEALFVGSLPIYRVSGRTNLLHVRQLGQ